MGPAVRTAGFVHFRNEAGFQQSAGRGEGDVVCRLILEEISKPFLIGHFLLSACFHAENLLLAVILGKAAFLPGEITPGDIPHRVAPNDEKSFTGSIFSTFS